MVTSLKTKKVVVKNSGFVNLSVFMDERGLLAVGEVGKEIPFLIKRFFFITDLEKSTSLERGGHAHIKTDQVIFCLKGSFLLELDDGKTKQDIFFDNHTWGIRLGPGLWHKMKKFSPDCVILVVANRYYKESDYLRDYSKFLKFVKTVHD
ncbi:MAG TPA: FdtA/QdtA family cupin domain-containing protein [Candidatus Paceibacterota bacterium]|nr:FdtA/QdtA family cupin domain-containing protein [Candidatus Paceibacterota bacterium]